MVGYNNQSSPRGQAFRALLQEILKCVKLVVYDNAKRLENLSQITIALIPTKGKGDLNQVSGGIHRAPAAGLSYLTCKLAGIADFAVMEKTIRKVLLTLPGYPGRCRHTQSGVHAKVKRSIKTGGKAPLRRVDLVGRDAQISENTLNR